jgi:hypothetical protein
MVVYLVLTSGGDLRLMSPRYTSNFYDVQARRMFHGHLTVPPDDFGLEAFVVNGHTHMYFGPLPSFLRMPVLLVTSRFDGRLTQLSMALALALLLWATVRLSWQIRGLLRGDEPVDRLDVVTAALAPFTVGAASVVLWLGAVPVVYNEAILWGVATATTAASVLVSYVVEPRRWTLPVLGVVVAAVLFSRAAIGFGTVTAVGVLLAARWWSTRRVDGALLGLAAVVVVPMVLYVGLNEARFHRALGPPYAQQVWSDLNADRQAALAANGGSLFNVNYVPSTALAYLRPDGVASVRLFPFVDFRAQRATVIGGAVFDTRDRTGSVPATMPALTGLAAVGVWGMVSHRHRRALMPVWPLVLGGAVAIGGVLTIGFIAQRYLGDFLPLLLPLALTGLVLVVHAIGDIRPSVWRRVAWAGFGIAVAVSVWVNFGLGVLVQRLYQPPPPAENELLTRHGFLEFQLSLDERLFGNPRFLRGPEHPADDAGTRGELFVVGECEQLLWHDSWLWFPVEPLPDGTTPLCHDLLY